MKESNAWFILAEQYLGTSILIMEQLKANRNRCVMIDDQPIEWDDYFEATKWSDFNTFVPAIFLMQHGIELMLKGLVLWIGGTHDYKHEVKDLLAQLKRNDKIPDNLISLFEGHVGENPKNRLIKEFKELNTHLTKSSVHVGVRYPEAKGKETNFSSFRYREQEILSDVDSIIIDLNNMLRMTVALVKNI